MNLTWAYTNYLKHSKLQRGFNNPDNSSNPDNSNKTVAEHETEAPTSRSFGSLHMTLEREVGRTEHAEECIETISYAERDVERREVVKLFEILALIHQQHGFHGYNHHSISALAWSHGT